MRHNITRISFGTFCFTRMKNWEFSDLHINNQTKKKNSFSFPLPYPHENLYIKQSTTKFPITPQTYTAWKVSAFLAKLAFVLGIPWRSWATHRGASEGSDWFPNAPANSWATTSASYRNSAGTRGNPGPGPGWTRAGGRWAAPGAPPGARRRADSARRPGPGWGPAEPRPGAGRSPGTGGSAGSGAGIPAGAGGSAAAGWKRRLAAGRRQKQGLCRRRRRARLWPGAGVCLSFCGSGTRPGNKKNSFN